MSQETGPEPKDEDVKLEIQEDIIEGSDPSPDAAEPMHERPDAPRHNEGYGGDPDPVNAYRVKEHLETGKSMSYEQAQAEIDGPDWKMTPEEKAAHERHIGEARQAQVDTVKRVEEAKDDQA
ncbi:MAG TPA: hypothetical protein VLF41_03655 [Candidatus Nanoarchaeia archaeon]|nr:hypothetical protein [Candidatus Nanoarchaeia archaeon]